MFLEFVAQGNAKFISNRAAIVKMRQNQSLVDLKKNGLTHLRGPMAEDIFLLIFPICFVHEILIRKRRLTLFLSI